MRGGHVSVALSAKAVGGAAAESVTIVAEAVTGGGSLRAPACAQGGGGADTEVYVEAARQARAHIHAVRSFVQEAKGRHHARP